MDPHIFVPKKKTHKVDHVYDNVISVPNASGAIIIDGQQAADTKQCNHCGGHWIAVKGSGKIRGRCPKCKGDICSVECMYPCVPWREKYDHVTP